MPKVLPSSRPHQPELWRLELPSQAFRRPFRAKIGLSSHLRSLSSRPASRRQGAEQSRGSVQITTK
ncbi:hypothetical protein Mapa_000519 [Marchantia paleacea]|nr:hypothetical protein Mapa_000519 [Marchantia paleacea]